MAVKAGYKIRYTMDDTNTTVLTDSSGNGLDATAVTSIEKGVYGTNGRSTNAIESGFYRLNALTSYTNFTLSTVFKLKGFNLPTTTQYQGNILGLTTGNANGVFIAINGTKELTISYYNGSTHLMVNTGIYINIGEWNHYSLVGNNGVYKLYLNGTQVASLTSSHNVGLNLSSCYVNGTYNANQYTFGVYDDVIVWESSLTDSEVYELNREYNKISRLLVKNPTTNSHYSFDASTLINIPSLSEKSISTYGVDKEVEVRLDTPFNKMKYVQDTSEVLGSGKVFTHDIDTSKVKVNKLIL